MATRKVVYKSSKPGNPELKWIAVDGYRLAVEQPAFAALELIHKRFGAEACLMQCKEYNMTRREMHLTMANFCHRDGDPV